MTEEFRVYELLSMVGEAGGYLGLFLGISCYQIFSSAVDWMGQTKSIRKLSGKGPREGIELQDNF